MGLMSAPAFGMILLIARLRDSPEGRIAPKGF